MTAVETRVVDDAAASSQKRWWQRPLSARSITLVALVMIAAQGVIRGVWIFDSWFLLDDFLFTSDIGSGLDDLGWYLRIHQGHFMPLSFGLVKIAVLLGSPFSWTIPAVEIVTMQVLAALACWWMLRTAFGNRPAILAGLGFYLFSPLTMPSIMWWAVAINQLPNQIGFFGLLASHIQYCRSRQTRWLVLSSVFLTVSYLSYAKTGLMVIAVAAITLLWFSFGPPWSRFWIAIKRYRPAWLSYGAISLLWLVVYLERTPPVVSVPPTGFLPLTQAMVWETLLPSLVGGPWRWTLFGQGPISYVLPPLIGVVAAAGVVGGVVVWSWGTRLRSLQVLWPLAIYVAASATLVYTGRTVVVSLLGGSFVGQHLQYVSDMAPLLAFTSVALFVPVVGAFDPIRKRRDPVFRFTIPRWVPTTGATIFLAGSLWTSHLYAEAWLTYPDRTFTQISVAAIRADRPTFADTLVPSSILNPILGDKALIKNYYSTIADDFHIARWGTDLQIIAENGTIVRAGVRDPIVPGALADDPPVKKCIGVSPDGRWATVVPPAAFGLWLQVDYRAQFPEGLDGRKRSAWSPDWLGSVSTRFGDTEISMPVRSGLHSILIAAPEPNSTVRMRTSNDVDLCVTSIRYGQIAPTGGAL